MKSQKSRSKRLKRRSRLQRGGGFFIRQQQIENREYDFEMMSYNNNSFLVIKNTPDHLRNQIGLIITRAYKSSNANININSFTTVDDLKNFALNTEGGPIDIMIETDNRLQDMFKVIFIERNQKANAKINDEITILDRNPYTTMTISPQMPSEGGKHSRKRRRTTRRRKSRKY